MGHQGGIDLRRGVPLADQEEWSGGVMARCSQLVMDASGIGMQMGERMRDRYGSRVEPREYSMPIKQQLASGISDRFNRRTVRVPREAHELRRSVLSIKREYTSAANEVVSAPRSRRHGHVDAGWALAMAVRAAGPYRGVTVLRRGPRHVPQAERLSRAMGINQWGGAGRWRSW